MSHSIPSPGHEPGSPESAEQSRQTDAPSWDRPPQEDAWSGYAGTGQPYASPAPPYGGYPPAARPTNTMAVITLVAGIAGFTVVPVLGSIVAVIIGPIARKEIARTGEDGSGMVTAGIIMGWIGIAIGALLLLLVVGAIVLSLGLAVSVTNV